MRLIDAERFDVFDYEEKENGTFADGVMMVLEAIDNAPTIEPKAKVIAQIAFDEDKLREIVHEAVERFKEEYDIVENPDATSVAMCKEWIPCIERLPEVNGESYLTYQGSAKHGFCQVLYYDDGWNCYHGDKENEINGVVAWMPLPEPYKESE